MKLSTAIARFRDEEGVCSNSYEWYRRSALETGHVSIGPKNIRAWKSGGVWQVDDQELDDALEGHRRKHSRIVKITEDLTKGMLHGHDGDTIHTLHGGYKRRDPFKFVWSDDELWRHKNRGTWFCNQCNQPAQTKHEKAECHRCADWNGCGRDCTLSEVSCKNCGLKRTTDLA